jgi:EAL domain-containing protein (putative c-di-GMP-specific phosphodiesterase class I)
VIRVWAAGVRPAGRGRFEDRVWPAPTEWALVAATLVAATLAVRALGGAPGGLLHIYYLPVLYVAARHGWRAATVVGVVAGLAAGPLVPASTGGPQPPSSWLTRLAFFTLVGVTTAWLARQEPRALGDMLNDVVLGRRLRGAVRRRVVRLHFQPVVRLSDGQVTGVEALCRWRGGGRDVPPGRFILAAERTGAIIPLGREVLRLAIQQTAAWGDLAGDSFVAVNVSPTQLVDPQFLPRLDAALEAEGVPPSRLVLEITETAILTDTRRALDTLRGAHARGMRIALDDFGTGESSLAYLTWFPVDVVKIDMSFVTRVDTDPTVRTLVLAIVEMATALGATTIAEGVERPEQLAALRSLGCAHAQGFWFGRPTPAAEVDWMPRAVPGAAPPRQARRQAG